VSTLSMQGVCNMGASPSLVPARGVRALSRATVTTAVVCGGLAIASGHPAQADDPTVLTGTYRLYFDGNGSTVDSVPIAHTSDTYLYAFRSACLAGGCVANGTRLGPDPDQKAISAPGSEVGAFPRKVNLRFTDGSWVMSAPYGRPCGNGGQGSWMTEWSLTHQQKGVMTGIRKDSPAGTLCPGDGGGYLTEPMTATLERDVDPGVDVTAPT
jgi:hypothetical protein